MYKINTTTMNRTSQTDPIRQLPIWLSLVPVLMLIAMIVVTIRTFGSDSLSGAIQVVLIASSAVCCVIGMAYGKVRWKVFERMIMEHVASVSSALIILLLIGALGGAWMVSGIVPTMIYYGVKIIHPDAFLVTTCIISAVVSVMTGGSCHQRCLFWRQDFSAERHDGFGIGCVWGKSLHSHTQHDGDDCAIYDCGVDNIPCGRSC